MRKMSFLVLAFVFTLPSYALEVDEKLTLRIVGVSDSKKTMLINRGIEDGLAVGDHAKFFVSVGVVARGVVIKTSPTKSVWSMYRLVNKDYIRSDQVLKLKVTPAVKITKDESRMLVNDDLGGRGAPKDPRDIGIPLAEGADDLSAEKAAMETKKEDFNFGSSLTSLLSHNREIFGMAHYSAYKVVSAPDDSSGEVSRDATNIYLKMGGEWYFKQEESWYSRFSFLAFFALDRMTTVDFKGAQIKEDSSEFGFGVTLHPLSRSSSVLKLIPYLNYTFSLGSVKSVFLVGKESSASDLNADASRLTHAFGGGVKFYTQDRFGLRLDYAFLLRSDSFAEGQTGSYLRNTTGSRITVGLSYRL